VEISSRTSKKSSQKGRKALSKNSPNQGQGGKTGPQKHADPRPWAGNVVKPRQNSCRDVNRHVRPALNGGGSTTRPPFADTRRNLRAKKKKALEGLMGEETDNARAPRHTIKSTSPATTPTETGRGNTKCTRSDDNKGPRHISLKNGELRWGGWGKMKKLQILGPAGPMSQKQRKVED